MSSCGGLPSPPDHVDRRANRQHDHYCNDPGRHSCRGVVVTGVAIALGTQPVDACRAFDRNGDGAVTIDELLRAVRTALDGCELTPPA
jgi:hypothetical protein